MARTPDRQSAPDGRTRGRVATIFQYLVYALVLGLLGLIVAVAVAVASLPGYDQLSRRSDLGQMIRVRSSNGTVLVSLGPSFGQWLRYDDIPPAMRRGDDRGRGQEISKPHWCRPDRRGAIGQGSDRERPLEAGRVNHHPTARETSS
jgi:hypothetical protein